MGQNIHERIRAIIDMQKLPQHRTTAPDHQCGTPQAHGHRIVAIETLPDAKRCGVSLGLIVLSLLRGLIAESAGPALFPQRRAGFNQENSRILKFRTMACQKDVLDLTQVRQNYPRISPLWGVFCGAGI